MFLGTSLLCLLINTYQGPEGLEFNPVGVHHTIYCVRFLVPRWDAYDRVGVGEIMKRGLFDKSETV
jgi:hypothetical protein